MNNLLVDTTIVDIAQKVLLITLAIGTILVIWHMFDEEEFNLADALKDTATGLLVLVLFFAASGIAIAWLTILLAIIGGLMGGFVSAWPVKLWSKKKVWYTKGSLVFMGVWAVIFTASQISEQVWAEIEWWWIALALFGLWMNVGSNLNIAMRQKLSIIKENKRESR